MGEIQQMTDGQLAIALGACVQATDEPVSNIIAEASSRIMQHAMEREKWTEYNRKLQLNIEQQQEDQP